MKRLVPFLLVCFLLWVLPAVALPQPWSNDPAALAQDQKDQKDKDKDEDEPKTEADKAKIAEMEKKACESLDTKYKTETDKSNHPTPKASADKGLIYVVRPTMWGNKVQTKLAANGQFKGVNRGDNYFFFELPPGQHYFCSQAENKSVVSLNVEAGKTYYLQQKVTMGFMKARNKLAVISDEEGQKALAKTHPSTWEEKK